MSMTSQHAALQGHPVLKLVLTFMIALGIADDVTIVLIIDNIIVLFMLAGLILTLLKELITRGISFGSWFVQTFLTGATGWVVLNDASLVGIVDNVSAFVMAVVLNRMAASQRNEIGT